MVFAFGCCLALLEMTFVFMGLLILHGLRKIISPIPFYLALGLLFVFSQLLGASGLQISANIPGFNLSLSSSVMLLPILVTLIVVYLADGTLETQRLMIGFMAGLGMYAYLAYLTNAQITWNSAIQMDESSLIFSALLNESIRQMAALVIAFTLDIFLLPIFFQRLYNLKLPLFAAITGSLLVVQFVDMVVFSAV